MSRQKRIAGEFRETVKTISPKSRRARGRRPIPLSAPTRPQTATAKTGRNEPCSCGSERKFKKCCGRPAPDLKITVTKIEAKSRRLEHRDGTPILCSKCNPAPPSDPEKTDG